MGKTVFIPAFSNGALNQLMKNRTRHAKNNKLFNFYSPSKDNLFNYPYILLSAHYNLTKDIKKVYGVDLKKTLLLGDSGGFQIATGVLTLTDDLTKRIFNWLENNTTYAINLDLPPHVSSNTKSAGIFNERMEKSMQNFEYFAKHQTGKTKFLNVLHGREIKLIQRWYDRAKKFNDDFTGGWAIGSASLSTYNVLLSLAFLFQNNEIKRLHDLNNKSLIHILGLSKPKDMIFLMYFVKKLEEIGLENIILTYDSSTPQTSGVRAQYVYASTPEQFRWMQFTNQIKFEKDINYNAPLPCKCPICKELTLKDLYTPSEHVPDSLGPLYYGYIVMHNLFCFINFKWKMEKIIETNSKLIINSILPSKMQDVLRIIDKIIKHKDRAINTVLKNKKILLTNDDEVTEPININSLFT